MHEFGVMSYLLEAVEAKAQEVGARRVVAVNLALGDRASIVDDSLLYYFTLLTPGTLLEGAQLNVRRVPTRFYCSACGCTYPVSGADFACPTCGALGQITDEGGEFLIESIAIEREETA